MKLIGHSKTLYHPYWRHAGTFLGVSLLLLVVGYSALFFSNNLGNKALLSILAIAIVMCLLVSFFIAIFSKLTDRKLRRLLQEEPFLSWEYEAPQWIEYCKKYRRMGKRTAGVVGSSMIAVAIIFSVILHLDQNLILDSVFYTWLIPCAIGGTSGVMAWSIIRWNDLRTQQAMLRRSGQFILGPSGFYITGQYRPITGISQTLTDIRLDDEKPQTLILAFHINAGRYSNNQTIEIPIPNQQFTKVKSLLQELNNEKLH